MTRLIDADAIPYVTDETYLHEFDYAYRYAIDALPTVEAIPIEWIKKHIENDRQSAEKATSEKNDKLRNNKQTVEICEGCMLFD